MGHAGCTVPGKNKPNLNRSTIMKRTTKIAAAVLATLGLGLAVASAHAPPGMMGGGMGGGMGPGMMGGMHGGMGAGMAGHGAGPMAGQQLMTPEEQTAMREKMRAAATPEERQKIAEANRAEMQKRAKEKGITLPEMRGPGRGMGPNAEQHKH
jgi:Spy/CpxP family protein refolding chaperone